MPGIADPVPAGARHPGRRVPLDLCRPATVRAVARRSGLVLKRRLGQHFLVDRTVLDRLLVALDPQPQDEVLEIGAGMGTLTVALAPRVSRVVAVEVDPACLRAAAITLRGQSNVTVVEADARHLDPAALGLPPGYLAAGSIPYNLTGVIITRLTETAPLPRRAVLLVQREVAARLAAPPGGWSLATVAVRTLATVERIADVPPDAFEPPPAVHSSIVRLTPAPALDGGERAAVLRLARAAFQLRRKTLRHGVTRALGDEAAAMEALAAAGIDPSRRPGTLSLEEWRGLASAAGRTRGRPVST